MENTSIFWKKSNRKKEVIINCWILKWNIFTHWWPISVLLGRINLNLSLILGLILIFSLTFGNKSKRKNHLHARFVWFLAACGLKLDSFVLKPQRQPLILLLKFGPSEKGTKFEKNLPLKIWHYSVTSNFKWKIFSNFVAFSE